MPAVASAAVRNIYVPLPEEAVERLRALAARELRGTKEQATWLILDGLKRAEVDVRSEREPVGASR
jgi:hypothetical protein